MSHIFHVTQWGTQEGLEWLVWAHASSIPKAINRFLVNRDEHIKRKWKPTAEAVIGFHTTTVMKEQEIYFLHENIVTVPE